MKLNQIKVGDKVQVIERVEGRYSRYVPPEMLEFWLEPEMIGTVGAIKVPYVSMSKDWSTGSPRNAHGYYFVCVDFFSPVTNRLERASVDYTNLIKANENNQETQVQDG